MASHPRVDVSFAPTNVFAKHFPDEVKAQAAKFNRPNWAVEEEAPPVIAEEQQLPDGAMLVLGVGVGLFFVGVAAGYFLARWMLGEGK